MTTTATRALFLSVALLLAPVALVAAFPAAAEAGDEETETRTVTFRIGGMVTPNCPVLVESAARSVDGVTGVDASLERRTARVRYIPSRTTPERIQAVIRDATGFEVEIVDR